MGVRALHTRAQMMRTDALAAVSQRRPSSRPGDQSNRQMGPRRVNVFRLSDGWRGLDMDEAKRRVKREARNARRRIAPKAIFYWER
jgi:hypothetical protein